MPDQLALRTAIEDVLNILGSGDCSVPGCEGCKYEHKEAVTELTLALAREDDQLCPRCKGRRWEKDRVQPEGGRPVTYHACPRCNGSGTAKDYEWREHSKHYADAAQEK